MPQDDTTRAFSFDAVDLDVTPEEFWPTAEEYMLKFECLMLGICTAKAKPSQARRRAELLGVVFTLVGTHLLALARQASEKQTIEFGKEILAALMAELTEREELWHDANLGDNPEWN